MTISVTVCHWAKEKYLRFIFLLVFQLVSLLCKHQDRFQSEYHTTCEVVAKVFYLLKAVPQKLLVFWVAEIHNVFPQKFLILKELGERSSQFIWQADSLFQVCLINYSTLDR